MTPNNQLRVLVSYAYYRDVDLEQWLTETFGEYRPRLFADSGAFSRSRRQSITVKQYADWVQRYKHLFTTYANLDVIGNPVATSYNQQYLEGDHGLQPLPVFHADSDLAYLKKIIDRYDYFAVGGMVGHIVKRSVKNTLPLVERIFDYVPDGCRVHGFGVTSWRIMSRFKWYSVDSTTWLNPAKYGELIFYDHDKRRIRFIKKTVARDHADVIANVGRYGLQVDDLFADGNKGRYAMLELSGKSFVGLQNPTGIRIYLGNPKINNPEFRHLAAALYTGRNDS